MSGHSHGSRIVPSNSHKRSEHFIGMHDESLPVAVRVHNPDRSPATING
jgi:hypothetical protein